MNLVEIIDVWNGDHYRGVIVRIKFCVIFEVDHSLFVVVLLVVLALEMLVLLMVVVVVNMDLPCGGSALP